MKTNRPTAERLLSQFDNLHLLIQDAKTRGNRIRHYEIRETKVSETQVYLSYLSLYTFASVESQVGWRCGGTAVATGCHATDRKRFVEMVKERAGAVILNAPLGSAVLNGKGPTAF